MESILQGFIIRLVDNTSCPNAIDVVQHVTYAIVTSISSVNGSIPNGLYTDINAITSNLPASLAPHDNYNIFLPCQT